MFVFHSTRADRLKILAWRPVSGLVLLWKRLDRTSPRDFC
ncbi:transposase [Bradyrhizobium sp. 186]|nr:transposase [Bradyrhizobium sp. 186]